MEFNENQLKQVQDSIKSQIKSIEEGLAKKESVSELESKLNNLMDVVEKGVEVSGMPIIEYLEKQQAHIDTLEKEVVEKMKVSTTEKKNAIKEMAENKEFIQALKTGQKREFEMKTTDIISSDFTADTGTVAFDQLSDAGVAKYPWLPLPVWNNVIKILSVNDYIDSIKWYEENSRTDSAGIKTEGSASSQSDLTLKRYKQDFEVIAHHAEVSKEVMEDSSIIQGEINDLLYSGLMRKVESQLVEGTGSSQLIGLQTAQTTFALPSGMQTVSNPNYYDVLMVAAVQAAIGDNATDGNKKGYGANVALMHPADIYTLRLTKDSNGNYIIPPFMTGQMQIGELVVRESYDVGLGSFLVYNSSLPKLYIKRQLRLTTSENVASNFLADIETIKADVRLSHVLKNKERKAIIGGTFTAALAALAGA